MQVDAKLFGLVKAFRTVMDREVQGDFVLFGSAAISLNGIDLQREIADLDVFVSATTFERLKHRFALEWKGGKHSERVPFYKPAPDIEILQSFPGVSFDEVQKRASQTPESEGFPVGALDDLVVWKKAQGRDKDLKDIAAIQTQLAQFR